MAGACATGGGSVDWSEVAGLGVTCGRVTTAGFFGWADAACCFADECDADAPTPAGRAMNPRQPETSS